MSYDILLVQNVLYYCLAFFLGSFGGTLSTFVGGSNESFWNILAAGVLGGFVATCFIGVSVGRIDSFDSMVIRYLFIAGLVGCLGKKSLNFAFKVLDLLYTKKSDGT